MSADIEKMYRQFEVHPNDQDLQRILWRDNPQEPVSVFRLKTVTYGTASAPFLATRSLKQLALDGGETFPEAAKAVLQDFYVDDVLTGRDSMQDALQLQHQLIALLNNAGFKLRKWCANNQSLSTQIPETDQEPLTELLLDKSQMVKSLGLLWRPLQDTFHSFVKPATAKRCNAKRHMSSIARIFDPLGLLGPITVTAKIILQQIWQLKLDWDEPLPPDLQCNWLSFQGELHLLEELTIPRRVVAQESSNIELNGFCDASERAYGACIYVTTSCSNGCVTHLLCAKSRTAPLKTVTLPHLELCAAVLLSRLVSSVIEALHRNDTKVTLWSDSTIVLAWIRAPPTQWKPFVAHHTAEIQQLTNLYTWQHVRTEDNPADLISRGCMPRQMLHANLWWQGPPWLAQSSFQGQQEHQDYVDLPERRSSVSTLLAIESHQLVDKYSSLMKLRRVTAYCLRFIRNLRTQANDRLSGPLSTQEIRQSLMYWIKRTQAEAFATELQALRNNHEVGAGSKLGSLCPFMDEESVIRVGGRLKNSSQPYDHKHPIILPAKHALTKLIAISEHRRQLHAGPTLLLASIRQRFWPLAGRRLVRQIIHQCVTCFRAKPKVASQRMGELPKHRTDQARPFLHTGIDYCGPIHVKESHRRGTRTVKAYIAIFVCFSTKAVHIELVGDLTSEAFLGALRRFISRRGRCSCLYSDNASTFVGANKELKELHLLFTSESHQEKIQSLLNKEQIVWKFIPPYAPNFGGLWEAAVKSAKYHLKRIIGNSLLTFEETYTSLTQIEACLNSRPLTPLSEDPNDLQALTPGHFLIGDTLTSMAEPSLQSIPFNRLSRWQYVQQLAQQFWSRWSREYLSGLQQRTKWSKGSPDLSIGDMVLIKEDNTPPLSWHMGRVLDLHPGPDGLTRVASLRTSLGVVKRAISKICPLPI